MTDMKKLMVKEEVIRSDLKLTRCRGRGHEGGCYITFRELEKGELVHHSEGRHDVVVDYDAEGKIVGIEFYDGFKKRETK